MPSIILITNPKSGNGAATKAAHVAQQTLAKKKMNVHIAYAEYKGHATQLAKSFISDFDIIVAIGDHETVNEVAQALVGTDKPLGIIPCGNEEGLAKNLGIPTALRKAIKIIYNKRIKCIDAPQINNEHVFYTDGVESKANHKSKMFNGREIGNYFKSFIMDFQKHSANNFTISVNGQKITSNAFVITLANGELFKSGPYIPSTLRKGSEHLDSVNPKDKGMNFGIHLVKNNSSNQRTEVIHLQSNNFVINADKKQKSIFGFKDKETEKWSTPLNFKIRKEDKLNVIVH
ncbi:diacylglycerol kinase family protein [Flammeovirga sp. OC4]|uniref:diacylglycerol/lipid kinase family protein n=1 Tax=Flammeovirga sp. OC4 TaxID=1382345 RepID=UPI0006939A32|nr:diacylglycerol kinase family protein [Flammeovirga sp. OC4]